MRPASRIAVIDCGSNSIKVLVAERTAEGRFQVVRHATEETRISTGIGQAGLCFSEETMRAGVASIVRLAEVAQACGAEQLAIVATSAVRDAVNGAEFRERVAKAVGLTPRLLSGEEEALYIARGVALDPDLQNTKDFHLCDLGGGSLELVHFFQGNIRQKVSLPLGAVRLKEQFLQHPENALTEAEQERIRRAVQTAISCAYFFFSTPVLVGTGGAVSHTRGLLAALAGIPLERYSCQITQENLSSLRARLCALPLSERERLPGLPRQRADIMPVALCVLETVLILSGAPTLQHSFYNLRYGLAAELLGLGNAVPTS